MNMFEGLLSKIYQGRMKVEDWTQGLYSRISIRRLGRCRGQPSFGNARDLQVLFVCIRGRQAKCIALARQRGEIVNNFLLTREDVIGTEPSKAILQSQAWQDLEKLIGLKSVKEAVEALVSMITENYKRELMEKEPIAVSLNGVFLGSPGTWDRENDGCRAVWASVSGLGPPKQWRKSVSLSDPELSLFEQILQCQEPL